MNIIVTHICGHEDSYATYEQEHLQKWHREHLEALPCMACVADVLVKELVNS